MVTKYHWLPSLAWSIAIFYAFWCTLFLTVFGKMVMTVIHSEFNLPLHSPICEEWGEKKIDCVIRYDTNVRILNCKTVTKHQKIWKSLASSRINFSYSRSHLHFRNHFQSEYSKNFAELLFTDKYPDDGNFDRRSKWPNHFYSSAYDNNTFLY